MTDSDDLELVAVLELSDDADEDAWSQTTWHAEVALRSAIDDASLTPDGDVRWSAAARVLTLDTSEGRRFAARLVTAPGFPRFSGVARQPTNAELQAWEDRPGRGQS